MSTIGTIRAGVIGWPIAHSRSPVLHRHWLGRYGITGVYEALPVRPHELQSTLNSLQKNGFSGINLTLPHKEAALALVERCDATARRIGAINTIVVDADGTLSGTNTDAYGFIENLRAGATRWRHDSAVVLGAGGAARAVIDALVADDVAEIRLVNRTFARASALADEFANDATTLVAVEWAARASALAGAGLLVNTTSLGMTGAPALRLDLGALPADALVNDIVYTPLETALLAAARRRGNPTVDGLGMLLHQAQPGFEAWFGVRPEVDEGLRRAVIATLADDDA